jgi:hypothetical protein
MSNTGNTYESLNIEPKPLRPHILAAATVVFGEDYYQGQRETISLSGFVQLNKWPMPGFKHRVDDRGYAEFDLELISAPEVGIKGFSYILNDRIQVLSNPYLPNTGHVRQIVPGKNFPAKFYIRRFGVLETTTMRLAHRDVIDIEGVIDSIPPYKKPLSAPLLGVPRGDGPGLSPVVTAPNVVRGVNLPEAWYTANAENEPVGITPSAFFSNTYGPCISMLVDPSLIIQTSSEGRLTLELAGKTHQVNIDGEYKVAAGAEILLFGPEKHRDGSGVLAQLARVAMTGNCPALGGRIMLRASFFKVSGGTLGIGHEDGLSSIRFPGDLNFDVNFEIATPTGVLYASNSVHVSGALKDIQPLGTELRTVGPDAALVTVDGNVKGRITGVHFILGNAVVGEEAHLSASGPIAAAIAEYAGRPFAGNAAELGRGAN